MSEYLYDEASLNYGIKILLFVFFSAVFHLLYEIYPAGYTEFFILWLCFCIPLSYLLLNKKINLFQPFYLFSLYYLLFVFSALALRLNGFDNNIFITSTYFYGDLDRLFFQCLIYLLLGYVSCLAGYTLISSRSVIPPPPPYSIKYNVGLIRFVAFVFMLIGVANFSYNVITLYSGDVIEYYKNISMRSYDFKSGGTTIGYHFLYIGAYLIFLLDLDQRHLKFSTVVVIIFSVIIFISQGRIFQTLAYIVSFATIYYYNFGNYKLNVKFFFFGILTLSLGVFVFLLRYASSLMFNGLLSDGGGVIGVLTESIDLKRFMALSFGSGNTPNFAILMKVVDSWSNEIGYKFGSSLLNPLLDLFQPFFSHSLVDIPAVIVKEQWYSHINFGNLPVTGIGEMYLNFGVLGPIFGMFFYGLLGGLIYNLAVISKSNIFLIFYAKFAFGFYMLYPKGEFNNFSLFWFTIYSLVIWLIIKLVHEYKIKIDCNLDSVK